MPLFGNTKPSDIQAVFVSDLHLCAKTPMLNQAFIRLIDELCKLPNLAEFYILGDWLDAWLGDDVYLSLSPEQQQIHWLSKILQKLKELSDQGVQVFIMKGNRDLTLSQKLCDCFKGCLLPEPFYVKTQTGKIRLEHGDALCTDDVQYQKYRRFIRHPLINRLLLSLPLSLRQKLAGNIKNKSKQDKQNKSSDIMDVNEQAILAALSNCDILIHGHTHRPNTHIHQGKKRLVLGDWQTHQDQVTAVIGLATNPDLQLVKISL